MRFPYYFAACLAVGVPLVLAAGCGSGGGTSPATPPIAAVSDGPVSINEHYGDFILTTTVPKRSYARGEVVPITFTLQNTGASDATFVFYTIGTQPVVTSLPANARIFLIKGKTTEDVRILSQTAPVSPGVVYSTRQTITLPAGQSQTFMLQWNQISSSDSSAGAAFTQVAAGTYQIAPFVAAQSLNGDKVVGSQLGTLGVQIEIK